MLTAAVALLALGPVMALEAQVLEAQAQEMDAPPDGAPPGGVLPDPFANFDCAAEPVTGSGPGFSNSRDASEDAARAAWGETAVSVYPEATWETAKDAGVSCVVQGLYSKCFAQGVPCRPKADGASTDGAGTDEAKPEAANEASQ